MSMNGLSTRGSGGCVDFFDAERTFFRSGRGVIHLTTPGDTGRNFRSEANRSQGPFWGTPSRRPSVSFRLR
jgi:hypothetical protein